MCYALVMCSKALRTGQRLWTTLKTLKLLMLVFRSYVRSRTKIKSAKASLPTIYLITLIWSGRYHYSAQPYKVSVLASFH